MEPTEKDDVHEAPESGDSPERERRAAGDLSFEEQREESIDYQGTGEIDDAPGAPREEGPP